MTGTFRTYLFSVCAAAVLTVLVPVLISHNRIRKTAEFAGGLLLLIVVLSPIVQLDLSEFRHVLSSYMLDTSVSFSVQNSAENDFVAERISQQCEEYILDKAEALGMSVEAKVYLGGDTPYLLPVRVSVRGWYSPWQKEQLSAAIVQDLGIPADQQEWENR